MHMIEREARRLAALASYGILDTDFEDSFDRVPRLAASLFKAPISLISLIDEKRQWFKAMVGLDVRETPREWAFCEHVVRDNETLVVTDARSDARFRDNPLVAGDPFIRFYAGAPLTTTEGLALGSLCVIDRTPRAALSDEETKVLNDFAATVVDLLEFRRAARRADRLRYQIASAEAAMQEVITDFRRGLLTESHMEGVREIEQILARLRALAGDAPVPGRWT